MKYKILIKDLNNEVSEDFWELNSNQVKLLDSDNIGYAIYFLKNGKLQFSLVKKKLWENKEEFSRLGQEIMLNEELSIEQKEKAMIDLYLSFSNST